MKKIFTLIALTILIGQFSYGKIFRVGYNGIPLSGVDYTNVNAAVTVANAGDTIQIYGNVGSGIINKRLVIVGFGYNLYVHPGLQAIGTASPSSVSLTFAAGSDGSFVTGVSGSFIIREYLGTHISISDITFFRCYGSFQTYNSVAEGPISNIKILSSVITSGGMTANGINDYPVINLQIFNCYVGSFTLYKPGTSAVFVNCVGNGQGYSTLSPSDAGVLVKNCIFYSVNSPYTNTVFENNFFVVGPPSPLPSGTNNRWSQSYSNLFQRINSSDNASWHQTSEFDENYFLLKSGSPAINGGFNGENIPTDCGIFGGEALFVYRPSGVPAGPVIYKLTAPTLNATTNPYNVTLSVKSNN